MSDDYKCMVCETIGAPSPMSLCRKCLQMEIKEHVKERNFKSYETLGGTIKKIRERGLFSQKEVAHMAGMTQAFLSQIESGKKNLSLNTLINLCAALGTSPDNVLLWS